MTRFWRDGFWRTSVYGVQHWVEGHWVERDDWDRSASAGTNLHLYYRQQLTEARAWRSATARYVNPNAKCPVCGLDVFFYQNEFGSRVYFDELGPPWPKHPCTDNQAYRTSSSQEPMQVIAPGERDATDAQVLSRWHEFAGSDPEYEFGQRYGSGRWQAWRLVAKARGTKGQCLALAGVEPSAGRPRVVWCGQPTPGLKRGQLVFLHRRQVAYFDLGSMEPVLLEVRRLRGIGAMVSALEGGQK